MNQNKHGGLLALATALYLINQTPSHAASGSIAGARITKVWHAIDTARGPNGRAWITLDTRFDLVGGCAYMGAVDAPPNWTLEFYVEHASFKAMYAQALLAYADGSRVTLWYDDGFGSGTTCRITSVVIEKT